MTIEELAAKILEQTQARLRRDYPTSPQWEWERVRVVPGPKYTKIDRGPEHNMSGMLMIENATGRIYGIKGYGKVHKQHYYGTLDETERWDWSGYYPQRAPGARTRQPVDAGLFRRTAPAWNCIDYPGEGMHYVGGGPACLWCGMDSDQRRAERADLPTSGNAMLDRHEKDADAALALHRNLIHDGGRCDCARPASVQVKRDGIVQAAFTSEDPVKNSNDAFAWLLKHQGQSVDWAIRHEGWEITGPAPGCCDSCAGE